MGEENQKNHELAKELLSEQNFTAAVVVGAAAMLLAAVAYGIVVATWPVSYGFTAAGIGLVIGSSMGFLGRGIATKFAVTAAVYTIIGCLLGNLFVKVAAWRSLSRSDRLALGLYALRDGS